MNKERDKFLTEALGFEIWDEIKRPKLFLVGPLNFSTWENFGKLFEFSQKQKWWSEFRLEKLHSNYGQITCQFINPDKFANAVYKILKERGI